MKKNILIIVILSILFIYNCNNKDVHSNDNNSNDSNLIRFAIIGDRTNTATDNIYENIVNEINRLRPDIVLNVGDSIEGYTEDKETLDKQWKEYVKIKNLIKIPYYQTVGNHDISPISKTNRIMTEMYEKYNGKRNYTFNYKGLFFIMYDSSLWEKYEEITPESWKWLETSLKKGQKYKTIIVFMHKPYWMYYWEKEDKMHELFKKYNVKAVFTGHYHYYSSGNRDGILYTEVGSSGGRPYNCAHVRYSSVDNIEEESFFHYAWVVVENGKFTISPIKLDSVLDWKVYSQDDLVQKKNMIKDGINIKKININDKQKTNSINDLLEIKIKNLTKNKIDSNITWNNEDNWTIFNNNIQNDNLNKKTPIKLDINEEKSITLNISNKKELFPLPKLILPITNKKKNNLTVKKYLQITRNLYINKIDKKPQIDGIKDELWNNIETVDNFCEGEGLKSKSDRTTFQFTYDDENIYVFIKATENNMEKLVAKANNRDEHLFSEDCIGFFFVPEIYKENKPKDLKLYQIYLNTNNSVFDASYKIKSENNEVEHSDNDTKWNAEINSYCLKNKDYWTMEIAINLKSLNIDKIENNDKWKLNFRRKQARNKANSDWQPNLSHDINHYGHLIFMNN